MRPIYSRRCQRAPCGSNRSGSPGILTLAGMKSVCCPTRPLHSGLIVLFVAMQWGNSAHMDNIAGMEHTSTKWWVRLERGRSHIRVLRNTVPCSREQLLKPRQVTRAQDRDQERLRLPHSTIRHAIRHIHSPLDNYIEQMTVPQTKPATLLQ